jgi:hypothetical protein
MCLIFLTVLLCQPFCLRRVTRRFRLSLEDKGLLKCISTDCSLFMTFISHKLLRCSLLSLTRYLSLSLPPARSRLSTLMEWMSSLGSPVQPLVHPHCTSLLFPFLVPSGLTAHPISCRLPRIWAHPRANFVTVLPVLLRDPQWATRNLVAAPSTLA